MLELPIQFAENSLFQLQTAALLIDLNRIERQGRAIDLPTWGGMIFLPQVYLVGSGSCQCRYLLYEVSWADYMHTIWSFTYVYECATIIADTSLYVLSI